MAKLYSYLKPDGERVFETSKPRAVGLARGVSSDANHSIFVFEHEIPKGKLRQVIAMCMNGALLENETVVCAWRKGRRIVLP